jgi:hypothetical protein
MTFTYPVGSAIPGALTALLELATATFPYDSTIWFGKELTTFSEPVTFQITEIDGDQQPIEIGGRYRRDETFAFVCLLTCYDGEPQAYGELLSQVMSNFNLLALAIGDNPSLTAVGASVQVVRYSEVGNFIITTDTDSNGKSAVTLSFQVRCQQRVESLS